MIEKVSFLKEIIPELWIFMVMFLVVYIPVSMLIGFWHRKTQLKVELTLTAHQNPFVAKLFRTMLDVQVGKASKEEIDKFRKMLLDIEKEINFESLYNKISNNLFSIQVIFDPLKSTGAKIKI